MLENDSGKIGLFDSGLGGLTILRAVARELPKYDYLYYGDTAHLPLGDKTEEEIFAYTKAGVLELFKKDCALVIIACNTASAATLRRLQDTFLQEEYPHRRILGVVIPTVEELINNNYEKALLIATRRTVASHKYDQELSARSPRPISLHAIATPELVPLIEQGQSEEAAKLAISTIESALESDGPFDVVILGCTHYTKLKDALRTHFDGAAKPRQTLNLNPNPSSLNLSILSQDEIIPAKVSDYLARHPEIETKLRKSSNASRDIILTLHRPDYDDAIKELLGGVMI